MQPLVPWQQQWRSTHCWHGYRSQFLHGKLKRQWETGTKKCLPTCGKTWAGGTRSCLPFLLAFSSLAHTPVWYMTLISHMRWEQRLAVLHLNQFPLAVLQELVLFLFGFGFVFSPAHLDWGLILRANASSICESHWIILQSLSLACSFSPSCRIFPSFSRSFFLVLFLSHALVSPFILRDFVCALILVPAVLFFVLDFSTYFHKYNAFWQSGFCLNSRKLAVPFVDLLCVCAWLTPLPQVELEKGCPATST